MHAELETSSSQQSATRSFAQSILAMLGLFFVIMMVALDQTVLGTALPRIVAELHGFELYAWVGTAYLLTSVIMVPIFGRLGDYYGRKHFVLIAILLFTIASGLCGISGSMIQLVLARALQGVAAGMLIGTAFASVADLFPDTAVRMRWQIFVSSGFGIANGIGPVLGGFLTEYVGWRSVFYINLPVGLLCLYFTWRYLPRILPAHRPGSAKLDWFGAGAIAVVLGSLQLLMEWLPAKGIGQTTLALAAILLLSAAALYRCEKRAAHPILPPEIFRLPVLKSLFTLSVQVGMIMFSLLFYMPLLLQGGFGLAPDEAGILVTPLALFLTIGSMSNSRIVGRISNSVRIMSAGMLLALLCTCAIAFMTLDTPHWVLMTCFAGCGFGLGLLLPNMTVFAQEAAGQGNVGIATAMVHSLRMTGGMIGTALIGTLLNNAYAHRIGQLFHSVSEQSVAAILRDPRTLLDPQGQAHVIALLETLGADAGMYVANARGALVAAMHIGILLLVAVAALSLWTIYRMPKLTLSGSMHRNEGRTRL